MRAYHTTSPGEGKCWVKLSWQSPSPQLKHVRSRSSPVRDRRRTRGRRLALEIHQREISPAPAVEAEIEDRSVSNDRRPAKLQPRAHAAIPLPERTQRRHTLPRLVERGPRHTRGSGSATRELMRGASRGRKPPWRERQRASTQRELIRRVIELDDDRL